MDIGGTFDSHPIHALSEIMGEKEDFDLWSSGGLFRKNPYIGNTKLHL